MKEKLLWIAVFLAFYGTIHFGFYLWKESRKAKIWSLIPQSALAVIQTDSLRLRVDDPNLLLLAQSEPFADVFLPDFNIDTLLDLEPELAKIYKNKVLTSVHFARDKLQGLHFVSLARDYDLDWIDSLASKFGTIHYRYFKKIKVREVWLANRKSAYSYFVFKDCFVGSLNPGLLDDVIRKMSRFSEGNFFQTLHGRMLRHKFNSSIEVYFDGQKVLDFLKAAFADVPVFYRSGKVSVDFFQGSLGLQGVFSAKHQRKSDALDLVQPVEKQKVRIPKDLVACLILPLNAETSTHNTLAELVLQKDIELDPSLDYRSFLKLTKGNFFLFYFKDRTGSSRNKLAIFQSDQPLKLLGMISEEPVEDSMLVSAKSELLASLFAINGFEKGFALSRKNQLLYSNSPKVIADYLVFEKRKSSFDTLEVRGAYLAVNTLSVWEDFVQMLKPEHENFVAKQKKIWSKFLDIEADLFREGDQVKAQIDIFWKVNTARTSVWADTNQSFAAFKKNIQAGPWPTTNPQTGADEVLVLESESGFYLLNQQGKVISTHPLQDVLHSTLQQVDLYANGKTQFLVVAGGSLRCFDRYGKSLSDFPIKAPEPVSQVAVLDFAGKRNYMIAATTQEGALYGFSKYATPLKPWGPIQLGDAVSTKVAGAIFGKESFVITLTDNGLVRTFNELAEIRTGFPLNFKVSVSGDFKLSQGSQPVESRGMFVSVGGELIEFDLTGKVRGRQPILGIANGKFQIISDPQQEQRFVIVGQNENQFGVFSPKGELLLKKDYFSKKDKQFKYYNLGRNTEVVAVWEAESNTAMAFDLSGKNLLSKPIKTNGAYFAFVYQEPTDSYKIVYAFNNKLLFSRFDR